MTGHDTATTVAPADVDATGGRALWGTAAMLRLTRLTFLVFWVILVLIFGVVMIVLGAVGELGGDSQWQGASWAVRYFPMSMGILLAPSMLPPLLNAGATRREFSLGASGYVVVVAVGFALLMTAGYLVESAMLGSGAEPLAVDEAHLFTRATQVHLVLLEYTVVIAAHIATGWLIATTYLRVGPWRGTYLIPVTVIPALAVDAVLGVGWVRLALEAVFGWTGLPIGLGVPVGIAVVVLTCYLSHRLLRRHGV